LRGYGYRSDAVEPRDYRCDAPSRCAHPASGDRGARYSNYMDPKRHALDVPETDGSIAPHLSGMADGPIDACTIVAAAGLLRARGLAERMGHDIPPAAASPGCA